VAEDEAEGEPKRDRIRVEKADGCVYEYEVEELSLEFLGLPPEARTPGVSAGTLTLKADVFAESVCEAEDRDPSEEE